MKRLIVWPASEKSSVRYLFAFCLLLAMPSLSSAVPLAPGVTLYPAPGEPDPVGGVVVGGGVPVPFAAVGFSGTLTSTVLSGDASNPFGPGALTFTYRLVNSPGSADS